MDIPFLFNVKRKILPILEHLSTHYFSYFHEKKEKQTWGQLLTHNALDILHDIKHIIVRTEQNKNGKIMLSILSLVLLCKAVLPVVHNCYLFLYMICLGGLHYNSLYVLSLHSTFAHLQVHFSLHVKWNKRTSACNFKLKLMLHITQTKTYFIKI